MTTAFTERVCSKCVMPTPATQFVNNLWRCPKHCRFIRMRADAQRHGKYVPTEAELERLTTTMVCPDCSRGMVWLSSESTILAISLQHYRDGSIAVVCRSCNSQHVRMPEDTYRDLSAGQRWCSGCKTTKVETDFYRDLNRGGQVKLTGRCKDCYRLAHNEWQSKNRDYYNAKQREGRARRKASNHV